MSNLYLDLLKIPANREVECGTMDTAKAFIFIKSHTKEKMKDNEFLLISAECRTHREVEEAADMLIQELKSIKKRSVKFFEKNQ